MPQKLRDRRKTGWWPSKIVRRLDEGAECRKALRSVELVSVSGAVNGDSSLTVVRAVCECNQKCFLATEYSAL